MAFRPGEPGGLSVVQAPVGAAVDQRDRFGLVAGPHYERWSDALIASFLDAAADLADAGLDSDDVRRLADAADQHREILDDVEPRLLHGDLWLSHPVTVVDPSVHEVAALDLAGEA